MPDLYLYARDNCHLCEIMQQALEPLLHASGCECQVIKINGDPDLEQRYGARVPVLVGGDRELCEIKLDGEAVKEYLASTA